MSEEELYKLLNIPNKPWIELTDEETQLFEKNNNYIKQLQQENKQLKEEVRAVNKGLQKVMERRNIYKRRYLRYKHKNKQLKHNRNELKKYIEENVICMKEDNLLVQLNVDELLNKMKELEDK